MTTSETKVDPLREAVAALLTEPATVEGVPEPYRGQVERALREIQEYLRAALAAAGPEPCCPFCHMPIVERWRRGTCGHPRCLAERAEEDEGNRRYEERRDEEI